MGVWLGLAVVATVGSSFAQSRPNILWLSSEDNGPALGAYGDTYADTPHLDRLAARGTFYRHAWSNAPVCAPARTAIITGVYPPATGSHHMRSRVRLPAGMAMFPQEISKPPREWGERSYDVRRWTEMHSGGHFAALEEPQLLAEEVRAFFRDFR